jgi:molybdopterin-guanine dinucleotide biosynthesis protein A
VTSNAHHKPSRSPFQFNPLEISFCGLSGSGKTTLIEKLTPRWRSRGYHFAYVKHDAHRFEMDREGKDTQRIRKAGAACVHISDPNHIAQIESRQHPSLMPNPSLLSHDFVVIEGYKTLAVSKIAVLDESLGLLEQIPADQHHHIIAFCGPFTQVPMTIQQTFPLVPYFQRDQVEQIDQFVESHLQSKIQSRPLNGLVLCGGKSQRMGQDKSFLQYEAGKSQVQRTAELLGSICESVFVSARKEQTHSNPAYKDFQVLYDSFLDLGPLSGIFSAMRHDPRAAWLVVAIDLPFLDIEGVRQLVENRSGFTYATAFRSSCQTRLEPLCTIYEPKAFSAMLSMFSVGINCPTKMLRNMRVHELSQAEASQLLVNANTPDEYQQAKNLRGAQHESNVC